MNQTFEHRIQSIEDQLKEIRKELEESLERYKHGRHLFTDYDWPTPYPKALETKCLWDSIPAEDRMKPVETVPSGRLEIGLSVVKELKSKDESGHPYWDATTFYPEGCVVRWSDGTIVKAKQTTCGNPDDWYDPEKVDKYGRAVEMKDELREL